MRSKGKERVHHEDEVLPEPAPGLPVPLDVDEDEAASHPAPPVLQGPLHGQGDLIISEY